MIHSYDLLTTVVGQLNILNKSYTGQGKARTLPKTPDFINICIDRAMKTIEDFVDDLTVDPVVTSTVMSYSGDSFSPVYVSVVKNINKAHVDRVTVIVDHKNDHGPGIATIVIIPEKLFDENSGAFDNAAILRDVYFGILSFDPYTSYICTPLILNAVESNKVNIPTYDIEMIIVAICCMHLNIRNWFFIDGKPAGTNVVLGVFNNSELSDEIKSKLDCVMKKCFSVSDLRNAVGNGNILDWFMFPEDAN